MVKVVGCEQRFRSTCHPYIPHNIVFYYIYCIKLDSKNNKKKLYMLVLYCYSILPVFLFFFYQTFAHENNWCFYISGTMSHKNKRMKNIFCTWCSVATKKKIMYKNCQINWIWFKGEANPSSKVNINGGWLVFFFCCFIDSVVALIGNIYILIFQLD